MYYRINYHAASRTVRLESGSDSAPAAISGGGYTNLGSFRHDNDAEVSTGLNGMQALADNYVLYLHVQDALYKQGVQDMQSIKIFIDGVRAIAIGTGTLSVAVGANSAPLTPTFTPTTATDKDVIYSSSDTSKATVNASGVVHGVAAGSAVITAKLKSNESITATRNVTVTA